MVYSIDLTLPPFSIHGAHAECQILIYGVGTEHEGQA